MDEIIKFIPDSSFTDNSNLFPFICVLQYDEGYTVEECIPNGKAVRTINFDMLSQAMAYAGALLASYETREFPYTVE